MKIRNIFIWLILFFAMNAACFADYNPLSIKEYNNGIDLTSQGNYEEAVASFQKAIELEPSFTDAYYNLGTILQYIGQQDKALEYYLEILEYTPDDYDVISKIAVIYYDKGDKDTTLAYIKKIPGNDPNFGMLTQIAKAIEAEKKAKIMAEQRAKKLSQLKSIKNLPAFSGFEGPTGIARDSKGNIYVANYSNDSIVCVNTNGEKKTIARGEPIKGPLGLVIDKNDNIFVANYESNQIVVLPVADRKPKVMPFIVKKPYFLMLDDLGVLYVSEQGSNTVSRHKLNPLN